MRKDDIKDRLDTSLFAQIRTANYSARCNSHLAALVRSTYDTKARCFSAESSALWRQSSVFRQH